jgi:hypothetical protein
MMRLRATLHVSAAPLRLCLRTCGGAGLVLVCRWACVCLFPYCLLLVGKLSYNLVEPCMPP